MDGALMNACKALESTLKIICDARGWAYDKDKAPAHRLLSIVFEKGLIPLEVQSHFNGLKTTLEGGVPTLRNKKSGHGGGSEVVKIPRHIAAYGLHLAAAGIVLLVESHKALGKQP